MSRLVVREAAVDEGVVALVLADAARRRAAGPGRPAGVRAAVVVALGALVVAVAGIVTLFIGTGAMGSHWSSG